MAIVVMSSPITRHRKPHLQKPDRNIPNPTFGVRFISCTLPILRSDCILSSWCFGFEVVQESWTLEWERSPLVARYTREQRLRAVRLYERYDRSTASAINELGYPSRGMLARWHRAWVEAGCDGGGSLDDGRGERYTFEQKRAAVDHYLQYGRCLRRTLRALGYPSHEVLARWIDELEPGRRRLRRAPVDEPTRRRAVARYACGEATSRRIGEELGVSADVVRNWKHTMLSHDDKEHGMHDEDARRAPEPVRDDPAPAPARDGRSGTCAGNATSSSRSWRPCGPNAWNSRSRWRPSDTPSSCWEKSGAQTLTT